MVKTAQFGTTFFSPSLPSVRRPIFDMQRELVSYCFFGKVICLIQPVNFAVATLG
jgi:hypothetical protein